MKPIDWTDPHNSKILGDVVSKNPLMKPRNQRKIASRILRGLPIIRRNRLSGSQRKDICSQLPDTAEYWNDIKRRY